MQCLDAPVHSPRHRTPLWLALLAALAPALPAAAQEAASDSPTNLDRITVTGSNIPRTDTETPSPVQVVTRQEIDRTGKSSLADYLQTLTSDGAGSVPKSFGTGFAGGGTGICCAGWAPARPWCCSTAAAWRPTAWPTTGRRSLPT